jgi:hypothetical protein
MLVMFQSIFLSDKENLNLFISKERTTSWVEFSMISFVLRKNMLTHFELREFEAARIGSKVIKAACGSG